MSCRVSCVCVEMVVRVCVCVESVCGVCAESVCDVRFVSWFRGVLCCVVMYGVGAGVHEMCVCGVVCGVS